MLTALARAALDFHIQGLLVRPHVLEIPLKAILPTHVYASQLQNMWFASIYLKD